MSVGLKLAWTLGSTGSGVGHRGCRLARSPNPYSYAEKQPPLRGRSGGLGLCSMYQIRVEGQQTWGPCSPRRASVREPRVQSNTGPEGVLLTLLWDNLSRSATLKMDVIKCCRWLDLASAQFLLPGQCRPPHLCSNRAVLNDRSWGRGEPQAPALGREARQLEAGREMVLVAVFPDSS